MSDTKFTPGPWEVIFCANQEGVSIGSYGYFFMNEDDSHLIAAAPEMYESLEEMIKCFANEGKYRDVVCRALDTVKKARGES